jgi:glutamate-ammonia-ligase adenylyltransferase
VSSAEQRDLTPDRFVAASGYAQEVLRRWQLGPEWLTGNAPIDDAALAPEAGIRRLRQLGGLRIQWREISDLHDVETTGHELSALAVDCLKRALDTAEQSVAGAHGRIRDADGRPARLAILALGKLGGDELNFNSDLDLVYCHAAAGESDGRRPLGPRDYFGRVVRELSRLLESVTAHGRAWVLDTRLRPFGASGALVWSLDAMEQYFLNEGRAWERYAWMKARPVAGDTALGAELLRRIAPFVFRRYLDYGLFDSLRTLHAEIDRRARREDLAGDVKRGPGGIRELEFLVQSLQLLRGGREPDLRVPGFLPALRAAVGCGVIDDGDAGRIADAYRFLRALENRIQLASGRQTHDLPEQADDRADLAALCGRNDWSTLASEIDEVRGRVRSLFSARFEAPDREATTTDRLWPPADGLGDRLADAGFDDPDAAARLITQLQKRLGRRPLSAEARQRLDRLMPELLREVCRHRPPDTGLEELVELIETISRRSAYLALLHERPQTLTRCVRVFRASDRVAGWITASPQLLDDLLAPDQRPDLPRLPPTQPDDVEHNLNALARFRQAGFVRTALGQLDGSLDRPAARRRLTRLAEAVLGAMAGLFLSDEQPVALIGYGNLGAGELHYTSDLDLVFLHAGGDAPVRPVQRMINAMQLPLPGGRLYQIDTRLRPNGNAGMLVSTLDSFADYQRRHAWTWEHQALIRARCVLGPDELGARFDRIRAEVLAQARDADEVASVLADMRRRQLVERRESDLRRVLGDIQFIAELGVLVRAAGNPELGVTRATDEQLRRLADDGWLDEATARDLIQVFGEAAALRDRAFLERDRAASLPDEVREAVDAAWMRCFGDDRPAPK